MRFVFLIACIAISACSRPPSVWDGVYTTAQSARGADVYNSYCRHCHSVEDGDFNRHLRGREFMDHWREDTLLPLFEKIRTTMPGDTPETLTDQQYLDVLAFILQRNGFPAGRKELAARNLETVLIIGKDGPAPLPDGATVQTVGCLTKSSESTWKLTNASRLVRSREIRNLKTEELKAFAQQQSGRETLALTRFQFSPTQPPALDLEPFTNHRLFVIGRLSHKGPDSNLLIARIQEISPSCTPTTRP